MPRIAPFEKYCDRYDSWFDRHADLYNAELGILRQVMPSPCIRGLEVGAGSGRFAVPLGMTIGVEPSEQMATKARNRGVSVVRAVAERLPFPDAAFDCVLMVTTICFVDDVLETFREAARVLKPQGCVVVGFVDRESALGQEYQRRSASDVFYKDALFVSAREVGKYLAEAGFREVLFKQALISGALPSMIQDGFGKGSFVVAKGLK